MDDGEVRGQGGEGWVWEVRIIILWVGTGSASILYERLRLLAKALDDSGWSKAAVVFSHLRLPSLFDRSCVRRLQTMEMKLKAYYNPAEPRDEKGKWTAESNDDDTTDQSGSVIDAEDRDCSQVLAECRV